MFKHLSLAQLQLEEHNLLLALQPHLLVAHFPEHSHVFPSIGQAGLENLQNRLTMIEFLLSGGLFLLY